MNEMNAARTPDCARSSLGKSKDNRSYFNAAEPQKESAAWQ